MQESKMLKLKVEATAGMWF